MVGFFGNILLTIFCHCVVRIDRLHANQHFHLFDVINYVDMSPQPYILWHGMLMHALIFFIFKVMKKTGRKCIPLSVYHLLTRMYVRDQMICSKLEKKNLRVFYTVEYWLVSHRRFLLFLSS